MTLTVGSLFAGIGGFDLGFERAGLVTRWQVENDGDCTRVLARHWPGVDRYGDVKEVDARALPRVDVVCGGFPCQDLSVAGRRAGLDGARSGLWWEFHRLLAGLAPRWVVVENVPGLLSSNRGRDMGALLGSLGDLGYGWAYRVLDAQWLGLAQRRERVFVVGCLGDGAAPAQVLLEPDGCRGHSPPSREAGQGVAHAVTASLGSGGADDNQGRGEQLVPVVAGTLGSSAPGAGPRSDVDRMTFVPVYNPHRTLQRDGSVVEGFKPDVITDALHGPTGNKEPLVMAFDWKQGSDPTSSMPIEHDRAPTLTSNHEPAVYHGTAVRRLTPRECERLQGFPDDWTAHDADGRSVSDSARYRMLGNAVPVPMVAWIARRLALAHVESEAA